MLNSFFAFLQNNFHLNILFLLGIAIFGGTLGGRIFQKLKIPQVVGYIIIGIIIGTTGFNIVNKETVEGLQPFSYFALGIIGFMIGGELKIDVLRRFGKQFMYILIFEGMTAFVFVSILTFIAGVLFTRDVKTSLAMALMLGAISSATAPAATTDVLWEYKAKGPLTRTVLGIVALDDALALVLFAIAATISGLLTGMNDSNMLMSVLKTLYEIFGSVIMGVIAGYVMAFVIKMQSDEDKILVLSLGLVLLNIGLAMALEMDMLLASMAMGFMVVNYSPRRSKEIFSLMEKFAPPVYVLFFVLVGAKLSIKNAGFSIIAMTLIYLIARSAGKMAGAAWGAKIGGATKAVQKYLPLCLFSQAGVAIGLSILASEKFRNNIGDMIVMIITSSTFVVQLLGPPSVKLAIQKAGEIGLDIDEDDLIKKSKVRDVLSQKAPVILETADFNTILEKFAENDILYFPVTDKDNAFKGVISVDAAKELFFNSDLSAFLLAHDIMEVPVRIASAEDSLLEIKRNMDREMLDYIPVMSKNEFIGIIDRKSISRHISSKMSALRSREALLE